MSFGSQQLRLFRREVRDGASIEAAALAAGMSLGEARLHYDADLADPPPPEAFEPITRATCAQPKEPDMARTARKPPEDGGGEIKTKDFALAVRLYRQDIKKAASEAASQMQSVGEAYKAIKKTAHIQPQAAKLAFKLDAMEEARRDDFLRCLTGLLKELNIPLQSNDLVDQAERQTKPRPKPQLVTIPSDGTEEDLAEVGEEIGAESDDDGADDDETSADAGQDD